MANPNTAVYPAGLPTDSTFTVATNSATTTTTGDIGSGDATIPVADNSFNVPCLIRIEGEIIRVGGKSGSNLTSCDRGFDFTTPASHLASSDVKLYVAAHHHNQMAAEVKALAAALGINLANVVQSGSQKFFVDYRAAISQLGTAYLGLSTVAGSDPTPVELAGSNVELGVASFAVAQSVQDHFVLPSDWTGAIDLDVYWRSSSNSGNVIWDIQTAGAAPGDTLDPSYNAIQTLTAAPNITGNRLTVSTKTGLTLTGLAADGIFFFKFGRHSADTLGAPAELVGLRFTIRRTLT
jgi:hypothetical protein